MGHRRRQQRRMRPGDAQRRQLDCSHVQFPVANR
ncbi:MAG: hypothetical protein ACJ8FY_03720 [Gemmataceae bacterium]